MMSLDSQADQTAEKRGDSMRDTNVIQIEDSLATNIRFDIKSQALAPALIEFGQQAGLSVLLQHALRDVQTKGVRGDYKPIAGLEILLADTGLEFKETDGGIVVSQPVARIQPIAVKEQRGRTILGSISAVLTAVLVGSTATAAETIEPPSKVIEEIVVTAQKREGSLRKTPIAITAVTAEMIEKLDVSDINALAKLAPSLTYNHAYAGLQLYIRGVGQDAPTVGNSPGVAVYVDGVYHGHQFANAATAVDTERFEVVRGPQGTLYGRNSTGGNINITSAKPHFDSELKIAVTAGSDSLQKYAVTGNLPIKEDLIAIRGTVASQDRDGYRKNLFDGSDIDGFDSTAAKLAVLVTPSADLEILFSADYQKDKGDSRPATYVQKVPGSGLSPLDFGGKTGGSERTDVYHDVEDDQDTELKGISATVTWQLGNKTLKSITSYRESERSGFADADGTDLAFTTNTNFTDTEEFSQEFNLLGSGMDERLEWIVGVNYYADDASSSALFHLPIFALFFPDLPPAETLDGTLTSIPFLHSSQAEELRSVGVFAQGTYDLSDQTRLTLGYRYTSEEKDVKVSVVSNITPPASHCIDAKGSEDWSPSTFKIGLDHDFSDGNMMYASLSRGFKAGGFNVAACGGNPFDEEVIDAFELGYKGVFLDGQLSLFLAAYYYDYSDMQVRSFTPDLSVEFQNAAEAEIYGVEAEFVLQPSVNWRIDGGLNWQSAEYEKGMLDDSMVAGINPTDITGNQLLRAPDLKANLGIQYTHWLVSGGSLEARYGVSYSDDYYVDAHENSFARIEERTLQNIRVTWTSAAGTTFVQLFGNNLSDEEDLEWLLNAPAAGGTVGMWAAPRTYGIRFGYRTP
jgi:iron complex outermembrane receptor protein